jgi:hypothetical protein
MAITFPEYIMQCCKSDESKLRNFLRKKLEIAGFTIIEDDYISDRASKNSRYNSVHNMLAVRGNPNICLVAHTDVCRDHNNPNIYYGDAKNAPENQPRVQPVIKKMEVREGDQLVIKDVIQDRECKLQVGGDDRLGVAINSWIGLHTGYDMALLFTTDEEVGLKSAAKVKFPEIKEYELCVQTDRGNHSHELVTKIGATKLCDYDTEARLLEIAYDLRLPRRIVTGMNTDVLRLKDNGICNNAVNMTCGYHESHSFDAKEYICIKESIECLTYVASIVKSYYLSNKKRTK